MCINESFSYALYHLSINALICQKQLWTSTKRKSYKKPEMNLQKRWKRHLRVRCVLSRATEDEPFGIISERIRKGCLLDHLINALVSYIPQFKLALIKSGNTDLVKHFKIVNTRSSNDDNIHHLGVILYCLKELMTEIVMYIRNYKKKRYHTLIYVTYIL